MSLTGCSRPDNPSGSGPGGSDAGSPACGPATVPCPLACKLVSLTVHNATQTNAGGGKNWVSVKKATDEVIVEATTDPNTEACWKQINWSGDLGSSVPAHPNQRKLPRSITTRYHLEAELGGVNDHVDVWIIWATVTVLTSGQTPPNSAKFQGDTDATENLGAITYDSFLSRADGARYQSASGKVALVAVITPRSVGKIISAGWAFRRERWGHDWVDRVKKSEGNTRSSYWNTTWVDDTSVQANLRLTPDSEDKIYDIDGPNVRPGLGQRKTYETYNNFRQWIEWNGETCSDKAEWYWRARWSETSQPNVTLKDLGRGNKPLPDAPL